MKVCYFLQNDAELIFRPYIFVAKPNFFLL
jgi:hypothetical protein